MLTTGALELAKSLYNNFKSSIWKCFKLFKPTNKLIQITCIDLNDFCWWPLACITFEIQIIYNALNVSLHLKYYKSIFEHPFCGWKNFEYTFFSINFAWLVGIFFVVFKFLSQWIFHVSCGWMHRFWHGMCFFFIWANGHGSFNMLTYSFRLIVSRLTAPLSRIFQRLKQTSQFTVSTQSILNWRNIKAIGWIATWTKIVNYQQSQIYKHCNPFSFEFFFFSHVNGRLRCLKSILLLSANFIFVLLHQQ